MTLALVAVFATAMSTTYAQAKPGKAQNGSATKHHINRGVKPTLDADHLAIKQVSKDCRAAERLMKAALPIYEGHRHKAMEINKVSIQFLAEAFRWVPGAPSKPFNVQQLLSKIGDGNEVSASKYSSSEVARSQELMKKALAQLQKARTDLSKVQGAYGGYIGEAGQLIDLSIQEAMAALNVRR